MPSNKIAITFILCFAVVVSTWLLFKTKPIDSRIVAKNAVTSVSVSDYKQVDENTNDDWKKLLTTVDPKDEPVLDLTQTDEESFDDTTLTAQMSRDFMSQYLLLKKGGQDLTSEDANKITSNVLSAKDYTTTSGAVYTASNLHVTGSDKDAIRIYRDTMNAILKKRSTQIKDGPVSIVNTAVQAQNPDSLSRLSGIVTIAKGLIQDLLDVEVPKDAVNIHVNLLNSSSEMLSSLEAMGQAFNDPVKSLAGTSKYNQNMVNFQNAITDMSSYFIQKLGSAI